eukprot:jgi/Tetstr1/455416/TSEL_042248.t1
MATNADLNNAEAARVEAEVRAQVLQDDSAFQGVHAGAKERLHDNTSPSDAKGSNLVVIDVSDTKGGKKPLDTSWEKCLTLPWKLVEAVPLSYAKAIHDASGSREVFNEDGTMVRKKWYVSLVRAARWRDGRSPEGVDSQVGDSGEDGADHGVLRVALLGRNGVERPAVELSKLGAGLGL